MNHVRTPEVKTRCTIPVHNPPRTYPDNLSMFLRHLSLSVGQLLNMQIVRS